MAAILNSAILDSPNLHKTLTQTNSIWLKLIHSHLTWWWQPSSIWPSWIQPSQFFLSYSLTLAKSGSQHLHKNNLLTVPSPPFAQKTSLTRSDSNWWWQPSWILPCWIQTLPFWIQTPCYLLSDSLKTLSLHSDSESNKFNLTQTHSFSCKLMMAAILKSAILDSTILHKKHHLFILTQLDDGSHLELCHLGFTHFVQNSDSN